MTEQSSGDLLTIAECAKRLRMSPAFVRAEIERGRLTAKKHQRESGRTRYRVQESQFEEYRAVYWPDTNAFHDEQQRA